MADTDNLRQSRIWLLIGDKPGDNAQARSLVTALDLPFVTRRVVPKPEWALGKPPFRPTLEHLDLARSDPLGPPWPELIVTIGRRPAAAALWVQEQSGGKARIVLIGRPKRWAERFALIVAPSQFRIPPRDNLIQIDLPLMRADRAAVAAAREAWADRLADLPRPLTAVLVGGATKPFRFDPEAVADFLAHLRHLQADAGGTCYLTTSRRTPPEVADALARGLPRGGRLYRWSPEADPGSNPYLGLLAHADRFVVTGDSISMMVEVASLGRPLAIFALPPGRGLVDQTRAALGRTAAGLGPLAHLLHRLGVAGYARDLGAIHRLLYRRGLAVPLGAPFRAPGASTAMADEVAPVVERMRALLTSGAA